MTAIKQEINMSLLDNMSMSIEDITATLQIMRMQEERGYKCRDYLSRQKPRGKFILKRPQPGCPNSPVDAECRFKMAEWFYQIVDCCKFSSETVAIAMSYLDRYLSTNDGGGALDDRRVFQLVAMTSFYTAIKIHEPEAIDPSMVARLSRGTYTEREIENMEVRLLQAIEWHMNPPTAISFIKGFFILLPKDVMNQIDRDVVYELAQYQAELAVNEYSLIGVGGSTVAFCAILNALETVDECAGIEKWMEMLADVACIDVQCSSISVTQEKLCQAANGDSSAGPTARIAKAPAQKRFMERRGSVFVSPRSVVSR